MPFSQTPYIFVYVYCGSKINKKKMKIEKLWLDLYVCQLMNPSNCTTDTFKKKVRMCIRWAKVATIKIQKKCQGRDMIGSPKRNLPGRVHLKLDSFNVKTYLKHPRITSLLTPENRKKDIHKRETEYYKSESRLHKLFITCPDAVSNVYHIAPVWPSCSTEIFTEPRTVLLRITSQP